MELISTHFRRSTRSTYTNLYIYTRNSKRAEKKEKKSPSHSRRAYDIPSLYPLDRESIYIWSRLMHHAQRLEQEADSAWSCRQSKLTYIYIQRHRYKIDRIDRYIMFDLQQYSLKHATCTRLILSLVVDGIVYHAMEEDQGSSTGCSIKEKAGKINGSCGKRGCKSIINCVIFGLSREHLSSSWCTRGPQPHGKACLSYFPT